MMHHDYLTVRNIISFSLMIFLVFGSTIRSAASTIAFFIFIFSCIYLYRVRGKVVAKLTKQEKVWLYSVVFLNIVVLLSSYNNFRVDFSSIDALTRFLFAIPVYFLIRRVGFGSPYLCIL